MSGQPGNAPGPSLGGQVTPVPKPLALGTGRAKEQDEKRQQFESQLQPLDEAISASVKLTKPLKGIDNAVRVAEQAAMDARGQARGQINKRLWQTVPFSIQTLEARIADANAAYKTEADRLDAKIDKRLEKLAYFKTSQNATGIDETAVTKAISDVTKARLSANAETAKDKRLVAIAGVIETANEAAIAAMKSLKSGKNDGLVTGLTSLRAEVAKEIGKATDTNEKKRLEGLLTEWDKTRDLAAGEKDANKKNEALLACKAKLEKLLEDAVKASGGKLDEVKQTAFKKVLETQYGLIVTVPAGHNQTNYEMFAAMLDKLPHEHTWTDSMAKLTYDIAGSSAAYNGGSKAVKMGKFTKEQECNYYDPEDTSDPKTPIKMNSFNMYTLHEVGHAVDDRYGIMNEGAMKADGYGGWQYETVASTVDALAKHIGGSITLNETVLKQMIEKALTTADTKKPDGKTEAPPKATKPDTLTDEDWKKLEPFLKQCVSCLAERSPWYRSGGAKTDKRSYHQAYGSIWVSYSLAGFKNTVEPYQWRSPSEWFAEIYAYSWMTKKVPPGMPGGVKKYLYSEKH